MGGGGWHTPSRCAPLGAGSGGGSGHIPPSFPASRAVSWHLWKTQAANPAPTSPPLCSLAMPKWENQPGPPSWQEVKSLPKVSVGRDREKKNKREGKRYPRAGPDGFVRLPAHPHPRHPSPYLEIIDRSVRLRVAKRKKRMLLRCLKRLSVCPGSSCHAWAPARP